MQQSLDSQHETVFSVVFAILLSAVARERLAQHFYH